MDLGITDKVALITGGDSGIGLATARLLAQEGVKIALLDKTTTKLEKSVQEIKAITPDVVAIQADLAKAAEVEAARDKLIDHYGGVDIVVHCAGITGATGPFLELSDEQWLETIEVDLMAAVRICRTFIPLMQKKGWGRLILITSEDAVQPYVEEMPYCAAKAGVLNLTKNLSNEFAKDGVLINAVAPAFIATPMTDAMMEKRSEEKGITFDEAIQTFLEEKRPHLVLKRRGKPEEVAAVIGFLCSEHASFVVGSNYRVDGGSVAGIDL